MEEEGKGGYERVARGSIVELVKLNILIVVVVT